MIQELTKLKKVFFFILQEMDEPPIIETVETAENEDTGNADQEMPSEEIEVCTLKNKNFHISTFQHFLLPFL